MVRPLIASPAALLPTPLSTVFTSDLCTVKAASSALMTIDSGVDPEKKGGRG